MGLDSLSEWVYFLQRVLNHLSVMVEPPDADDNGGHRRLQQSSAGDSDSAEWWEDEVKVDLQSLTLLTSPDEAALSLGFGNGLGRSLQTFLSAGWPRFELQGWTEQRQVFGYGLVLSPPDSDSDNDGDGDAATGTGTGTGAGGAVGVSVSRDSLRAGASSQAIHELLLAYSIGLF